MRTLSIAEQRNSKLHSVAEARKKWEQAKYTQKIIRVKLLCKSSIKAKCEEYLNGEIVEEYEGGEFLYEMNVPENEHFWYGTILAFADQAIVIEPPDLVERICLNCNQTLKQYEEV